MRLARQHEMSYIRARRGTKTRYPASRRMESDDAEEQKPSTEQ
jgi:hypothetical protein